MREVSFCEETHFSFIRFIQSEKHTAPSGHHASRQHLRLTPPQRPRPEMSAFQIK